MTLTYILMTLSKSLETAVTLNIFRDLDLHSNDLDLDLHSNDLEHKITKTAVTLGLSVTLTHI